MPREDYLPVRVDDIQAWSDDQLYSAMHIASVMIELEDRRPQMGHFDRRLVERRLDAMLTVWESRQPVPS